MGNISKLILVSAALGSTTSQATTIGAAVAGGLWGEWHLIKLKLAGMSMFSDFLTCFPARFVQVWIRLGPALYRPRFNPAGSFSYPYLSNESEQGRRVFFAA